MERPSSVPGHAPLPTEDNLNGAHAGTCTSTVGTSGNTNSGISDNGHHNNQYFEEFKITRPTFPSTPTDSISPEIKTNTSFQHLVARRTVLTPDSLLDEPVQDQVAARLTKPGISTTSDSDSDSGIFSTSADPTIRVRSGLGTNTGPDSAPCGAAGHWQSQPPSTRNMMALQQQTISGPSLLPTTTAPTPAQLPGSSSVTEGTIATTISRPQQKQISPPRSEIKTASSTSSSRGQYESRDALHLHTISESPVSHASPHSQGPDAKTGQIEPNKPQAAQGRSSASMETFAVNASMESSHAPVHANGAPNAITLTANSSPSLQNEEFPPMHTSSVLPDTRIAHPKPITLPSNSNSTPQPTQDYAGLPQHHHNHNHQVQQQQQQQHLPERAIRNSAFSGNVAQLEATAERLSTGTSSIGDAIRDLHGELKRSDSRRSTKLAASLQALSEDPPIETTTVGQLNRHLSNASSIVATNIAARNGGYSPGAFVMSPNHSLSGRIRSGSKDSAGRSDFDNKNILTRHGPGKASVRSVRSTKLSLAEISESEPTALTQSAFDAADVAPPAEYQEHNGPGAPLLSNDLAEVELPRSDSFQKMLDQALRPETDEWESNVQSSQEAQHAEVPRPSSSQSVNTFQQAMDAFADFDGVFYQPDQEFDGHERHAQFDLPDVVHHSTGAQTRHSPPMDLVRPESYVDPHTGQKMLYYPARVPAMLNLPPKLSNKPKAEQRYNRRSQVLSAMAADADMVSQTKEAKQKSDGPDPSRKSFLPDPLAGHRGSFNALSQDRLYGMHEESAPPPEPEFEPPSESVPLRKPQRLSRSGPEDNQSRASHGKTNLPAHLRASAFFDLPPPAAPPVEVKQGSAMATLDSMLDASTSAPVSAFTNHAFAGSLGDEVYGKEKKKAIKQHKASASASTLQPETTNVLHKKRSSRSWFQRKSSYNSEGKSDAKGSRSRSPSAAGDRLADVDAEENQALTDKTDEDNGRDVDDKAEGDSENDSSDEAEFAGQPTTLLAELQLRKQQAKQRTQPRAYGQAAHMTLLEMDAVAETQRKMRQNKRVNLAWEDPRANHDQNGSDDEDIPLAIIAAKHQGAKNMADLERPVGLLERREIEDNEPLSQRRSRLQGHQPMSTILPKRQSMATLSAHLGGHARQPSSLSRSPARTPDPAEPEIEEETLGDRKKRLEAKELPKARPVSCAFSSELLSQFGDRDESKDLSAGRANESKLSVSPAAPDGEEETLGQRRRRLQAEREAREREMSHNTLVGGRTTPGATRRLSMADMLSAHPKRDDDTRAQRERMRIEQQYHNGRDQAAKMEAMRMSIPASLGGPSLERSGGFRGGFYNDGIGGLAAPGTQSTSAINTFGLGQMSMGPMHMHNRSTTALSGYGMPMAPPVYTQSNFGGMPNRGGYNAMYAQPYAGSGMQLPLQMEMPPEVNTASMKRIDQWRHGVMP